jgi:hypothetical protein
MFLDHRDRRLYRELALIGVLSVKLGNRSGEGGVMCTVIEGNRCIIPNFIIPNGRFSYVHYSYIAIFLGFKVPKVQNS